MEEVKKKLTYNYIHSVPSPLQHPCHDNMLMFPITEVSNSTKWKFNLVMLQSHIFIITAQRLTILLLFRRSFSNFVIWAYDCKKKKKCFTIKNDIRMKYIFLSSCNEYMSKDWTNTRT